MKNYEEMSDFDINCTVALHLGKTVSAEHECIKTGSCYLLTYEHRNRLEFNPCNNPSDAWPIIVENEIRIDPRRTSKKLPWMADIDGDRLYSIDKNPLRAAMICFLKMKDAQNDHKD